MPGPSPPEPACPAEAPGSTGWYLESWSLKLQEIALWWFWKTGSYHLKDNLIIHVDSFLCFQAVSFAHRSFFFNSHYLLHLVYIFLLEVHAALPELERDVSGLRTWVTRAVDWSASDWDCLDFMRCTATVAFKAFQNKPKKKKRQVCETSEGLQWASANRKWLYLHGPLSLVHYRESAVHSAAGVAELRFELEALLYMFFSSAYTTVHEAN